jgi:hypothetical protein
VFKSKQEAQKAKSKMITLDGDIEYDITGSGQKEE